jgi:hypothetical protein
VNNTVGEVCGQFCCDTATEDCCEGTDGTFTCIPLGDCCPGLGGCCVNNAIGEGCGAFCCDIETQRCCTGTDGTLTCIAEGDCCADADCVGEGDCAGTCNTTSNRCEYPDATRSCGDPACSPGNEAALTFVCDGTGACKTVSEDCSPYLCAAAACPTTCSEGTQCIGNVCNEDNTCCPPEDSCFDEFCCPDDPADPGVGCCPAGDGCCQCFNDSRSGPFCCGEGGSTVLCRHPEGNPADDTCISTNYYTCVAGSVELKTTVCDNDIVCNVPCCGSTNPLGGPNQGPGGTCCGAGLECSAGECVAVNRPCTRTNESTACNTAAGEICATGEGQEGTCCPAHRSYRNQFAEAATGIVPYWECCSSGEAAGPSVGGDPFCHGVPDLTATSNKSWGR